MEDRSYLAREFERESHRIDQLIWDAMALRAGETALFCGFTHDADWIARARDIGVDVSVVESNDEAIRAYADMGINVIRGSTSMIAARDASYDAAISFHYLHEIDPLMHANVVSELARVGKRTVIVEPAPPRDLLGKRIAMLYSRAKRELGSFENYQQLDYWKKLLSIVKADVSAETFSFTRVPPRDAITDTVALILDTMEVEEIPQGYLDELKALAKRSDAQLLPQARFVLVGAAIGEIPAGGAGTRFRERELAPEPTRAAKPAAPAAAATPAPRAEPERPVVYAGDAEPEFPPLIPPPAPQPVAAAAPPPAATPFGPPPEPAPAPFGLPMAGPPPGPPAFVPPQINEPPAPFAMPFGLPPEPPQGDIPFGLPVGPADPLPRSGFGWEWEPPETEEKQLAPEPPPQP